MPSRLRQGIAAFNRQDYVQAASILHAVSRARRAIGAGLSRLHVRDRTRRAAETTPMRRCGTAAPPSQGDSLAQYSLGLLYDRGQGVPQDIVEASKWLQPCDRRRAAWRALKRVSVCVMPSPAR